jgi:hypothetical protein
LYPEPVLATKERRPPLNRSVVLVGVGFGFGFWVWQVASYPIINNAYPGAKNGIFASFIYKNEHFTKTGSGQT